MPQNKYFLIMNPTARSGRAKKSCQAILSLLKEKGAFFDFRWTEKSADAITLAQEAARSNYETVVAVGGDGTICEVISGLFTPLEVRTNGAAITSGDLLLTGFKEETTLPRPKLGIIHVGTSPDFNKYHHIPTNAKEAIEVLLKGKTKFIDVGKISYFASPGKEKEITSYFASNVNIGLGPQIAQKANSRFRKYLGDFLGTLTALLTSLMTFKKFPLKINIDGQAQNFKSLINLTLGKDPYLASGMRLPAETSPQEGKIYVLSIEARSLFGLLINLPKLYRGNFMDYKGARIAYAKKVEIDCCQQYPLIEFDGDVKGYLPARIEVLPKSLEIIVP